ncbi:MAG: ATP phosphoribosyltransferase [Betaproteobacteria bacterium AqS2]|uniref:ATP phosphoribosyltransferase n=1 Tax=Candidatus Amphirhobacter heronislandensis TaxID=1732024 RepID=A0A930UEP8_9GAMM|nr:ATP phosphoribosyltransferase [Betaproteobacteria bacterium AqS2]
MPGLTIALAKGRLLEEARPLLAAAGMALEDGDGDGRRLTVPSADAGIEFLIVRAADVLAYVGYGAAQLGVVGRDLLLEHPSPAVLQELDLGIGRCRLAVAAPRGFDYGAAKRGGGQLTVATKYRRLARRHLAAAGIQARVIRLYGSMELAPLVGLADVIVDLVSTGATLQANGLEEMEKLLDVSALLVANKAWSWRHPGRLDEVAARLREAGGAGREA